MSCCILLSINMSQHNGALCHVVSCYPLTLKSIDLQFMIRTDLAGLLCLLWVAFIDGCCCCCCWFHPYMSVLMCESSPFRGRVALGGCFVHFLVIMTESLLLFSTCLLIMLHRLLSIFPISFSILYPCNSPPYIITHQIRVYDQIRIYDPSCPRCGWRLVSWGELAWSTGHVGDEDPLRTCSWLRMFYLLPGICNSTHSGGSAYIIYAQLLWDTRQCYKPLWFY